MKHISLSILVALVLAAAGVTILQIWAPVFSWDTYFKIMGTLGIVFLVVGLIVVLRADLGQHKKLKDENYLD